MASDARRTLQSLIDRATSPTDERDQEARTAAVQACRLLKSHPELLSVSTGGQPFGAPARRASASAIHPDAERLRDWRIMLRQKKLIETVAEIRTMCADCGKTIEKGETVVDLKGENLSTHRSCGGWWWHFELPSTDDDVPF